MRLFVVTKSPIGLDGTAEIIGAFATQANARKACVGAGAYLIAAVELDKPYGRANRLLDVWSVRVESGASAGL
jgi:hypothetical protein